MLHGTSSLSAGSKDKKRRSLADRLEPHGVPGSILVEEADGGLSLLKINKGIVLRHVDGHSRLVLELRGLQVVTRVENHWFEVGGHESIVLSGR